MKRPDPADDERRDQVAMAQGGEGPVPADAVTTLEVLVPAEVLYIPHEEMGFRTESDSRDPRHAPEWTAGIYRKYADDVIRLVSQNTDPGRTTRYENVARMAAVVGWLDDEDIETKWAKDTTTVPDLFMRWLGDAPASGM